MAGKGDTYRPVNAKKWCENYDRIDWSENGEDEQKETAESPHSVQRTRRTGSSSTDISN